MLLKFGCVYNVFRFMCSGAVIWIASIQCQQTQTQFLEAISAVVLEFSKIPVYYISNRPEPGQRAPLKTIPPTRDRLPHGGR